MLVARSIALLHGECMAKPPSSEYALEPWQQADARRLNALWTAKHGKVSQAEFGESYRLGSQGMVSQYLLGRRPLNPKAARAFAQFLRVKIEEFSPRLAAEISTYTVSEDTGSYPAPNLSRGVPIVGTAQLGPEGFWCELQHPVGNGDGRIRMESRDEQAYAVRVVGDSMHPRIKSGEYVIVEPNVPVQPGDEVLIVTKDGRSMVKELLARRDGLVHLNSVNDSHGRMTLRDADIEKIHHIAAIAKSSLLIPE